MSKMMNNLSSDKQRTKFISEKIQEILEEPKRRILVLSDRVQLLEDLNEFLGDKISGLFIGKTSKEEKTASKTKRVLLATYAIASEGFNHPELNTLVFATPRSNVNQAIGRIYRKRHEISPTIVDIVDNVGIFVCQYRKRQRVYKEELTSGENEVEKEVECLFD